MPSPWPQCSLRVRVSLETQFPPLPSKAWLPIKKKNKIPKQSEVICIPRCMFTHANQPGTVFPFFSGLQDLHPPFSPP